jgi:hypothetical protein
MRVAILVVAVVSLSLGAAQGKTVEVGYRTSFKNVDN